MQSYKSSLIIQLGGLLAGLLQYCDHKAFFFFRTGFNKERPSHNAVHLMMHHISSVCGFLKATHERPRYKQIKYWNMSLWFFVFAQTQLGIIYVCITKGRCHALNIILSKLFQKMKEKCSNLLILLYTWICSLQRQQNAIKWRLVPYNKAIFPQWSNFRMETKIRTIFFEAEKTRQCIASCTFIVNYSGLQGKYWRQ